MIDYTRRVGIEVCIMVECSSQRIEFAFPKPGHLLTCRLPTWIDCAPFTSQVPRSVDNKNWDFSSRLPVEMAYAYSHSSSTTLVFHTYFGILNMNFRSRHRGRGRRAR